VVGDYNHNLLTEYHVTFSRPSGSDDAMVEWTDGAGVLALNAEPLVRTTDASDVLEVWDLSLEAGKTYTINFLRDGAADTRFYLYRSFNGSFFGFPSTAVLQGTSAAQYTAPATDRYGLVVVNHNGASGTYRAGVSEATVAAHPPGLPARAALQGVRPNPGSGPLMIEFELRDRGSVEFDVLDLAGRLVARVPAREWGEGRWTETWAGQTDDGSLLRPGIYFVRMKLRGETVGSQKIAIVGG
jgi:hypothetical protein